MIIFYRRKGFFNLSMRLISLLVIGLLGVQVYGQAPAIVQPGAPGQPTRKLPDSTRATLLPTSVKDVEFMQGMIMHHAQAVEMTSLIDDRTSNRDIQLLGERISKSQADEMAFMVRWLEARGQSPSIKSPGTMPSGSHSHTASLPSSHQMPGMLTPKQMEALKTSSGGEFDTLFLKGMIQHHEGALVMVRELHDSAGTAQDAEIFNFASDVDSGQRAEIKTMQNLLAKIHVEKKP